MSEWTDDRRDESADDQHDDRDEPDESVDQPNSEPTDRPGDDDVTDAPGSDPEDTTPENESPDADGTEPIGPDGESGTDEQDTGAPTDSDGDREPDDRRSTPRNLTPHAQAGPNDTSGDGDGDNNWLSSLIDALDRLDRGSSSGQRRRDRTVLDYDISIGTGLGSADDESSEPSTGSRSIGRAGGERPRKRRRSEASDVHHLTTRSTADELLVTADVASADPEEITVGFDDSTLVVAVSGQELDRVDVPWRDRSATATVNNGILTVRVTPEPDSTREEVDDE